MGIRLNKAMKEFNVGINTIVEYLAKKGHKVESNPSTKIDDEQYALLQKAFGADKDLHQEAASQFVQVRSGRGDKRLYRDKKNTIAAQETAKTPEPKRPATPKQEKKAETPKPSVEEKPQRGLKVIGHLALDEKGDVVSQVPSVLKAEVEQAAPREEKIEPVKEEEAAPLVAPTAPVEQKAEEPAGLEKSSEATSEPPVAETPKEEPKPAMEEQPASEEEKKEETPVAEAKPQVQPIEPVAPTCHHEPKRKLSVEERAAAAGEEIDGVYRLNSPSKVTAPKVVGMVDLSTLNGSMRPKKGGKGNNDRKTNGNNPAAAVQGGAKKKRNRIGATRINVSAAGNVPGNNNHPQRNNQQQGQTGAPNRLNNGGRSNVGASQQAAQRGGKGAKKVPVSLEPNVSEEDVTRQVKETLARLTGKTKGTKGAKYRKEKRDMVRAQHEEHLEQERQGNKILKITEFVTANELATMMDVPVTSVISTCMSVGIMISINQRMDAETIDLVAEEFGFKTEYISAEVSEAVAEIEDSEEELQPRAPIVTVMGHVDHGKTSLLDYIRKSNVIAGEAGGITQHIGAYNVTLENGRRITFLDTPGHEAFTAMRARGAQVTDIAIIIIAADDDIMPQTKEAINHAVAANVPIVFAINKIDKPGANPEKIKEGLAQMNFLVEEWGGKYQSQDISAKKGIGVQELLDKVLLEADMMELKANPDRKATGTVIESTLDKGRGYVATVLVSNGTLRQGDIVLAGTNYGRIKALFNERGQRIETVGPAMAATLLGLNGAPQAGDTFHVMDTEQEAREITNKREQLQREQNLRTHKMLTLDEVGRRIKLGSFKELNIIVKGDVDGSVEALSDSLIRLSTETIAVNVIHKGVGQISENDVTLAAASQAVIVGFQVRPSMAARKQAERDGVEIRQYSIIYDAIEEVKKAMEGMLEPILKEEVTAMVEVRQVYNISKVGLVAGAYVVDGKVSRSNKARLIRDGIVVFTGNINALKRFKDDVKEVSTNFECGISLIGCNDIKEGDIIETFQEVEVKQKL